VPSVPPLFVLASGSKPRLRVLRDAGFDPQVVVSGVDEGVGEMTTAQAVMIIAERKASAAAARCENALVLGCDSMLDLDGTSLGKPKSAAEIVDVWGRLSDRRAELFTGHCLIDTRSGEVAREVARTLIRFGRPNEDELRTYATRGEVLELAGAFSIEGHGAPFVEGIDGSPSNVLGLSLPHFRLMLTHVGVPIIDLWSL
jgi:septum formation protein